MPDAAVSVPPVYPPELSPMVTCERCDGKGALSAIAGHCFDIDGGLWHEPGKCTQCGAGRGRLCCPPCSSCHGTGSTARHHYAYCKRRECVGCCPTMAEIERMPLIAVFGEMLTRCIPQSPATKTHEGAVAAIQECDGWYHSVAYFARLRTFAEQDNERLQARSDALAQAMRDHFAHADAPHTPWALEALAAYDGTAHETWLPGQDGDQG